MRISIQVIRHCDNIAGAHRCLSGHCFKKWISYKETRKHRFCVVIDVYHKISRRSSSSGCYVSTHCLCVSYRKKDCIFPVNMVFLWLGHLQKMVWECHCSAVFKQNPAKNKEYRDFYWNFFFCSDFLSQLNSEKCVQILSFPK